MHKYERMKKERQETFERTVMYWECKGYHKEEVKIGIIKANLLAVIIAIVLSVPLSILFMMIHGEVEVNFSLGTLYLFFAVIILSLFIHEGLHGITLGYFCKHKWKSITFGLIVKYVTPYCCCNEAISKKGYLLGGIMPLLVLGFGVYVVAIFTGNLFILFFSFFSIMGAGGDIIMVLMGLHYHNCLFLDLPQDCGFMVFRIKE